MQKHAEKKFKVDAFDDIQLQLRNLGAKRGSSSESHHYYGMQKSNDVTKLVQSENKCEIHILKEENGTFTLTNVVKVKNKSKGIKWLEDHNFTDIMHIKMAHDDYEYAGGIVGLYTINDQLLSVILDFPPNELKEMTTLFDLNKAEVIEQPYNQYLQNRF